LNCAGDEVKVVSTPPFAESVTEGDIKWNKGMAVSYLHLIVLTGVAAPHVCNGSAAMQHCIVG